MAAYVDVFGNRVTRLVAPPGLVTSATISSSPIPASRRKPRRMRRRRRSPAPRRRPDFPRVEPLLRQRQDRGFRLANFGHITGGYRLVQAICDFVHDKIRFSYPTRARRVAPATPCTRASASAGFRPPRHSALPLHEHPCALQHRLSRRYRRSPDPAPMDFSAWFEVFLSGRWYTFDARHNEPRIGRVVMGAAATRPMFQSPQRLERPISCASKS